MLHFSLFLETRPRVIGADRTPAAALALDGRRDGEMSSGVMGALGRLGAFLLGVLNELTMMVRTSMSVVLLRDMSWLCN